MANKIITVTFTVAEQKLIAIRQVHAVEMFGDCVEDGEQYPCKTIRILDWVPGETKGRD